ncbi:MAG: DNA polymerase III subunit alpha [Proteobacteria bacterium]|nr:DNA polymerase III subunit alpha [Pseudomonadota bacterium]
MAHADFVHLRVHSAYSLLEGAIKIDELAALCRAHGMPAVAVTDTRNLFGALQFSLAAADAGVQPIIGCELAIAPDKPGRRPGHLGAGGPGGAPEPDKLVVLVQNEAGYRHLIKLLSQSYLDAEAGAVPWVALDDFDGASDGLIALTGGPSGVIGRLLAEEQDQAAGERLARLKELFPGRLYVEVTRHGLEVEKRIEGRLLDLAYEYEVPMVATSETFFADAGMFEAHDALICIAEGAYVADGARRKLTPEHRFKTAAEMRALFADLPEAADNTLVVAKRCAFKLSPQSPILPAFPVADGVSEAEALRGEAEDGLKRRLETHVFTASMDGEQRKKAARPYRERLEYELGVITDMGYPGYFLIVADFIKWAKGNDIPVGPGRGSGAGSVVAWSLTITDLDPLRFGLLFERFLNPDRVTMPDFDIDFCQDRRDEVISYVQQKYGRGRVAQIITFGKLQARAALRDVGRVLGMPYGQVDRICKLVPNNPANPVGLADAIAQEPQLQEMRADDATVARLLDIAQKLEGLYRHASTHAAGVVIADRPLDESIPLYRDPRSDMPVTQFSMKYVEMAGLVKFDFLGLKTLTVLERARELIAERGVEIDLSSLALDDAPTYEMLTRGETTGVFQLESSGMRDVLRKLRPDSFEDIIALVALFRPGPMDNIPRYIACKHGIEQPDYLHPSLERILKPTFGVMIYQEQVMQIAQVLAGYSLGAADVLRYAMGKKVKSEMEEQRRHFIDGAVARAVEEGTARQIFEQVYKFAGYGFNKSHAAAYALIAYQTAYLKANYPVEFLAASMTLDLGNTDKLNTFRQELVRLGIRLLPPDINRSAAVFKVETEPSGERAIRYALGALKNVGVQAMKAVVKEREANGPFTDLFDFAGRCDSKAINKRQLESLASAGAFDGLNANRAQVLAAVEALVQHSTVMASERGSAQESLFSADDDFALHAKPLPDVADWPAIERLRHEFEAIGFYLSAHPLDAYAKALDRLKVTEWAELASRPAGHDIARARLAGTVIAKKERTSARGNRFAFVQMSDASGMFEVTLFAEVLSASRQLLDSGAPVMVTVDARREGDTVRLTAQSIEALDEAAAAAPPRLTVHLTADAPLERLKEVIGKAGAGRGEVNLVLGAWPGSEVEIVLPGGYAISPEARGRILALPGVAEVRES